MGAVVRGPVRVFFVSEEAELADWVRAGFERVDEDVTFVTETDPDAARTHIAEAMEPADPRRRSPLVETTEPFDCVVCADDLGEEAVVAFVEAVRENHTHLPIVLFAEHGSEELASRAVRAGADDYVPVRDEAATETLASRVFELVERHREQVRHRRERERAHRILEHNPEVVTVFRPGGQIGYQNAAAEEVLGYAPEEMDGGTAFAVVHPDDWQSIREEFYDAIMDPEYVPRVEFRIRDSDGEWRTVESRGRNLLGDPIVNGVVVSTRDVTERRERERDLEAFRQVIENIGDGMYVLDTDGYFEMVTDTFLEYTGFDRDIVEGEHVSTFMRREDVQKGRDLIAELLGDPDRNWGSFEFVAENVHGEFRRLEDNVAVLTDEEGNFRGSVGFLRDVTDD